jgi:hypothetical protein
MTDIVERLRSHEDCRFAGALFDDCDHGPLHVDARDAAIEIERLRNNADNLHVEVTDLRAERDALDKKLTDLGAELLNIGMDRIAAENERDALRNAILFVYAEVDLPDHVLKVTGQAIDAAREWNEQA